MNNSHNYEWWNSLKHGGMLIAPARLPVYFPETVAPLADTAVLKLRKMVTLSSDDKDRSEGEMLWTVLVEVCGMWVNWKKGNEIGKEYSVKALTGEVIRPRWILDDTQYAPLPVFVDSAVKRLGVGKGRKTHARVLEWLRAKGYKIALLSNAYQWRLIYAGLDFDAWVEWDTDMWFSEGAPSAQLDALRILISPAAFERPAPGAQPPIMNAILESRKGQAELSSELGERVRSAVELLIQDHAKGLEHAPQGIGPKEIYLAATRMVMRLVVILFAEARDLLPRDSAIYYASYGVQGLRDLLEKSGAGKAAERLKNRFSAWPRIVSLCRLIFAGSGHQALPVPRYGGDLFRPGDPMSDDTILRAIATFENPEYAASDYTVLAILNLLCRSRVKIRQGRGSIWVDAPVDFSDLSSEYIGILYEGLLDYELKQASASDPVIFLGLGNQPSLNLSMLESMDEKSLRNLVESMKVKKEPSDEDTGDGEDEEPGGEVNEEDELYGEEDSVEEPVVEDPGDRRHAVRLRAIEWARRAVIAGKLAKRQRAKGNKGTGDDPVTKAAMTLIKRVVLPGEWYLVRWGGTRKGSGTFYTRPQLAVPTVHRTLRPLVFDAPVRKDNLPDESAPPQEWSPKLPEKILGLKVCDPAMGSGSFPVAALRFLSDSLMQSLYYHERIKADGERTLVTLANGSDTNGSLREEYLPCRPDADDFEMRLRARLKRYIVEECIYGVDLDPLAVELARLALWIETMDRNLPFEFLDHKLKCGNSLVGCWLSRFRDYPIMAWMRDGGDGDKGPGTQKIKTLRKGRIINDLSSYISLQRSTYDTEELLNPLAVHNDAISILNGMRTIPVHEMEERAQYYRTHIAHNQHIINLKRSFDTWCALWFWPLLNIDNAPGPKEFLKDNPEKDDIVNSTAAHYRFFHWELEFPDVFTGGTPGFDATIGNPPWEIQKPISKEYFSNIDPLYRSYGKQEALAKQKEYFERDCKQEQLWIEYNAKFKALSNWCKYTMNPFGDPNVDEDSFSFGRKKENDETHSQWRYMRSLNAKSAKVVIDIPFQHQGSADINSYKLFLELSYSLLKPSGMCGMIVPSGIYSDKGTSDLRKLFLNKCDWKWIFSFENKNKIFDIHRSFKFCPLIFSKGGSTKAIRTSFMRHNLEDWENGEQFITLYKREQVEKFSPWSLSILEINGDKDIEILDTIYSNAVLLGDKGTNGWALSFSTEFHMTNDSKIFPPRPLWEEKGYVPDDYGRWVSPNGGIGIPLYQGRLIGHYDFSRKGWVSGKGRASKWQDIPWLNKTIQPEFLGEWALINEKESYIPNLKICYMRMSSATNNRSMIATLTRIFPSESNVVAIHTRNKADLFIVDAILNSYIYDYLLRVRFSGMALDYYVTQQVPVPKPKLIRKYSNYFTGIILSLNCPHVIFAPEWLSVKDRNKTWRSFWALTEYERIRKQLILNAIVCIYYDLQDYSFIIKECDYPSKIINCNGNFNSKGFWRVDKDKPPELRHTVLSLVAFHDLQKLIDENNGDREKGIEAFCNLNNGEGWMLPEKLRLADYNLGHDDRAKEYQPVAKKFGPRFYDWQLKQTPEESWAECEMHARNILGEEGFARLQTELRGDVVEEKKVESEAAGKKADEGEQLSFL